MQTQSDFADLCQMISHRLGARGISDNVEGRQAAVAVVLYPREHSIHYVVIVRAARGRNPGQFALPGGKLEPGEEATSAAIREAQEEVGLPSRGVTILGKLDNLVVATGFTITPVVVAAPADWVPSLQSEELCGVYSFPLDTLRRPEVVNWVDIEDERSILQMRITEDIHIHPPTGAILYQFREVCLLGREASVCEFTQPRFTHS